MNSSVEDPTAIIESKTQQQKEKKYQQITDQTGSLKLYTYHSTVKKDNHILQRLCESNSIIQTNQVYF